MASLTDAGFVEMRLGKVVGFGPGLSAENTSFCVVLEGTSPDVQLPIEIGETEAFTLSATLTGIQFARPMGPQFAAGLLHALGGSVRQVRIDRLVEVRRGTAYGATVGGGTVRGGAGRRPPKRRAEPGRAPAGAYRGRPGGARGCASQAGR